MIKTQLEDSEDLQELIFNLLRIQLSVLHLEEVRQSSKICFIFASSSCSDMSSSFPVFIIFRSMYSPAALPLLTSAFTADEKEPVSLKLYP